MAVRIRLSKTGKRNRPAFKLVAADARSARDGKVVEILGSFDPWAKPPQLRLEKERIKFYTERGAQVSEAAQKVIDGKFEYQPYVPKKAEGSATEKTDALSETGQAPPEVQEAGVEANKEAPQAQPEEAAPSAEAEKSGNDKAKKEPDTKS